MSTTQRRVDANPAAVWAVLADPDNYAHWVVGCRDVRDADPGFPAVGTSFHHSLAFGPLDLKDQSSVLEADEPRRLVLHVRGRPLGRGRVELELDAQGSGTCVTIREGPASPLARVVYNPLVDLLLHGRNVEALRRLAELAEGREPEPETSRNSGADAGGGEDGPSIGPEG